ncbi:HAMP domain-containing sensor histidine kinase [Luteimonas sp. RD2P54]|uniref:histidine kinase n=1 Tax=Luteimonas endophytica TaxID=3042023 RepID=A0ABT6J5T0_9GAMM|nr:HAMP domain-containing sensor histidine kinase [Luteimonas endophytica]MDH5822192.1 HAMP domain-containing sensor histidine kinase [Luteimonas endophytica]
MSQGLPRKLRYAFLMQAALASLAIVVGITVACAYGLEVLINARLDAQAEEFWAGRAADPDFLPPATSNSEVHFVPAGAAGATLPEALRRLPPGYHQMPGFDRNVLVQQTAAGRLYVDMSFAYPKRVLWGGALALMLAGMLALYLVTWLTYRTSRRLIAPVSWLASQVAHWEPDGDVAGILAPERIPGDVGTEVRQLSGALVDLSERVHAFVRRERDFTRDASHELRTPLTVIRVATDMLLTDPELQPRALRSLQRIQRASRDMEAVIDAFLILAREAQVAPESVELDVREVVFEEVEKARPLLAGKPVDLRVTGTATPRLHAPPRVLGVMLGNLLSNACVFTEAGSVEVEVAPDRLVVRDTGIGMSAETLERAYDPFYRADQFASGKGMGLSIVRRLGERFGWPVALESVPGRGTTAVIRFGG